MAFFSVIATGVSIWAVIFLRRTLQETQETNRIQNESLKWQRRALSATEGAVLGITKLGVEFDKPNASFTYSLTFQNTGKSPAIIQGLWFTEAIGKKIPENPKLGMIVKATGPIFRDKSMHLDFGRVPTGTPVISQKLFDAVIARKVNYYCCCRIEYTDLYGTGFEWGFVLVIESEEVGENGVRFRLVESPEPSDLSYLREKEDQTRS